jgi:DNA repair exonuclease SbcCD ATPase subunit
VLAALNDKNNENLSRFSALQAAFKNVEPNMMQRFSQLVLSFEAELQILNLDPATTVYSEFQALTNSAASLEPLYLQESQIIATFSNERYGKRIRDILSKSDSIMNQIADRERDHKKRIQSLQQLRADYDGMAADADNVFNMFQAHIKRVNTDIEDIQASIQRCFDNPQSISIIQRIPFGLDCMASDTRLKNFRRSIEQHRQLLQTKVDQKLMRPQSFFLNSSQSRSAALDDLKSVALVAIGEAQQLLERYLNELQQPLEHPLKASPEFTDWLRLRFAVSQSIF